MKNLPTLIDAILTPYNDPYYQPEKDDHGLVVKTHCNEYVSDVAKRVACNDLQGLLANDMVDFMSASPNWSKIQMPECQALANGGSLVIAGKQFTDHGHVVVICPGNMKPSGSWGAVPSCVNIGQQVFIGKGINWAFPVGQDLPFFYVWKGSL